MIVIINFGRTREHPHEDVINVYKLIDERAVGVLHCLLNESGQCHVQYAEIAPEHRRRRFGHEMMYELERRWPGVTCSPARDGGEHSIPSWFALRDEIMRTDNPHVGRDDLPAYTPMKATDRSTH